MDLLTPITWGHGIGVSEIPTLMTASMSRLTPQVFKRSLYNRGVEFATRNFLDFTDDCQMAEAVGAKVCMTTGDYRNIKITTPEDIAVAEAILGANGGK